MYPLSRREAKKLIPDYSFQDPQGTTSMSIHQDAGGKVSGTITMDDGSTVNLQGEIKGTEVIGIASMGEKNTLFKLHFQGAQLMYTMIDVTADGKPDLANAQQFHFMRKGGGGTSSGLQPMARPPAASGQTFSGSYSSPPGADGISFTLQEDGQGRVTETLMTENGATVTIEAVIVGAANSAIGTLTAPNGNMTMIKLQPTAGGMGLAIAPKDGKVEDAKLLVYPRVGASPGGGMAAAAGGGNPLAGGAGGAAADPFARTFTDGNMTVRLEGRGGRYQGQIQFQGQTFPVTAQSSHGRSLNGKFTSGASSFDFTGQLQGSTLMFETGGKTYQLRNQGGGATALANPLGRGTIMTPAATGAAPVQQQAAGGATDGIQRHPMASATPGRLSDNNPQSLQWLNHLRGKLLSRLSSYTSGTAGGYSSNERMLLYPNGQFEYYSASSVSVQADGPVYSAGGSSGGQGTRRGTWRIVTGQGTSFLALVYEGSMQEEYTELDFRDNKTFIDGSRVFVTAPQ